MDVIKIYKDKGQLEVFRVEVEQIAKHIEDAYQDLKEARKHFQFRIKQLICLPILPCLKWAGLFYF